MTRKQFLSIGPAAGLAGSLRAHASPQAAGGRPKNILFLMADQHRPRALGVDGNPYARTPNLDALARSGVRFDHAYCTNPVCTPSRMSILSGLYSHNHGALNNGTPMPSRIRTMAHAFNAAGYQTAFVGKMHAVDAQTHGFEYRLDFNDWLQYLGPKARLYAEELGYANAGSGLPQIRELWEDGDPWNGVRERDDRKGSMHIGRASKMAERDHFGSFVARESIRFLKEHSREQPFFLTTSFLKPHDPFMPAARFAAMFRPEDMKLPETWQPGHHGAEPEIDTPEGARTRIAMYYGNLAEMDDCAGRVMAALRELGLEKDTIVLYTSDHGEMLGEHGLWQKFVFYEPSVGVPLILRVPGLTSEGVRSATPVSLTQIFPTLTELCGLPAPAGLDGGSFVRDLREPGVTRDTTVYSEFALGRPSAKYMIRRGDFKFNFYSDKEPELFNLREDPKEIRNLAQTPDFRHKAEEMKAQLFQWYKPPEPSRRRAAPRSR